MGSKFQEKKGASLVEVILAIALFSLFATALMTLLMNSYGSNFQAQQKDKAALYAQQGLEAVKSIRRQAWNLLANGDYGLDNASGYWELAGSSDLIEDKYTRVITIADACRSDGDIVDCPGTVDLYTKKIISNVTYTAITGVSNQVELTSYLTLWQSKDWIQADWSGGSGQSTWSDASRYWSDDGNIDNSTSGEIKLASLGGGGCGVKTWTFTTAGNYTFSDPAKIEVTSGVAQLISSGSGCSGTPTACTTYSDQTSCEDQGGCSWSGESCSNNGVCSDITSKTPCNACNGCTWSNPSKVCTGTLDCSAQPVCTDCSICSFFGPCSGTATACSTYGDPISCDTQDGCSWSGGSYPTDEPNVYPNSSYSVSSIDSWTSFAETAVKNGGEIYYQLSDDNGITWYWWNGSTWAIAGAINYNIASVVNTNISSFPITNQQIMFKAFLSSDGTQQIQLDQVKISCAQQYDWPFTTAANYSYDPAKIEVTGGVAQLVDSSGSSGSNSWDFDVAGNYTLSDPAKIEVTSGVAQLISSGSSCSGTPTACNTYGDQTSCEAQGGCSWSGGGCSNNGVCSDITSKNPCNACNGCNWSNKNKVCQGTLDCPAQPICTDCSICSFSGSCSGTATACSTYSDETSCNTQDGCSWGGGSYPSDEPYVYPNSSYSAPGLDEWSSFTETATKNGGEIYYQLSDDNGTSWYYWSGSSWAIAGATNYNTAVVINTNISVFPITNEQIKFRAFLSSDGIQQVQLDQVNIGWTQGEGGGGSCSGTPTACTIYGDQTSCEDQGGCTWSGESCSNNGVCSDITSKNPCNACNGCTWSNPNKVCTGTLDCSAQPVCTDCSICIPSNPCSGTPTACDTYGDQTSCETQDGCTWSGGGATYPTDNPTVSPITSYTVSDLDAWSFFTEAAIKNGGEIYYQLSSDDGINWLYWNDITGWTITTSQYNTADIINTNISEFPTTTSQIMFKAFLNSDGTQQIQLDNVRIGWGEGVGAGYVTAGWLESSAFDTGNQSAFNLLSWVEVIPSVNEDLKVQLATSPNSSGPWNWTGLTGPGTYYDDGSETLIPLINGHNDDQWLKYRIELTGDGSDTPILQEIKVNYLP